MCIAGRASDFSPGCLARFSAHSASLLSAALRYIAEIYAGSPGLCSCNKPREARIWYSAAGSYDKACLLEPPQSLKLRHVIDDGLALNVGLPGDQSHRLIQGRLYLLRCRAARYRNLANLRRASVWGSKGIGIDHHRTLIVLLPKSGVSIYDTFACVVLSTTLRAII